MVTVIIMHSVSLIYWSTYSIATFIAELALAKSSGKMDDPLSVSAIVIKSVTSWLTLSDSVSIDSPLFRSSCSSVT